MLYVGPMNHTEPTTHTYWISIGRNVEDTPLTAGQWFTFQEEIRSTVANIGGGVIETEVTGSSSWEGQEEDTHLFLVTVDAARVDWVKLSLSSLARAYNQDAIGFVGGPGTDTVIRP